VLAAAYAGAGRFGVEGCSSPPRPRRSWRPCVVNEPARAGSRPPGIPWQDEAHAAAHGGLWRMAYAPRSALSLAALLGSTPRPGNQARGSLPERLVTRAACYPIRGSRLSGCSARPEAASTQARSSPRSAGRRPRVRRASRSSRIDRGQRGSPPAWRSGRGPAPGSGPARGPRPRRPGWPRTRPPCMGAKYPGPTVPAGTARASSMVWAERFGEDAGHVRGCLALDHGVGVPVDNGGRSPSAGLMKKLVRSRAGCRSTAAVDQHPGQADRDVEMAGQLEHRPVRQGRIHRDQQRGRVPCPAPGQAAEDRLDPGQLVGRACQSWSSYEPMLTFYHPRRPVSGGPDWSGPPQVSVARVSGSGPRLRRLG